MVYPTQPSEFHAGSTRGDSYYLNTIFYLIQFLKQHGWRNAKIRLPYKFSGILVIDNLGAYC